MENNIVTVDQDTGGAIAVQQTITPMIIIQQAVASGRGVEELTQLMALQERYEANEARKAFNAAMTAFKTAGITVNKNKSVAFSTTKYKHATLDNVCETIGEELTKHGLSFRWVTSDENGKIKVTCILMHVLGHSEETSFVFPADTSGAKNAIQAIGSAITYGQRYTLLSITGTATGEDVDARDVFDDTAMEAHLAAINSAKTKGELLQAFLASVQASAGDKPAYKRLEAAKDARVAALADPAKTAKQSQPSTATQAKYPLTYNTLVKMFNETTDLSVLKAHGELIAQLTELEQDAANEALAFRMDELRNT